MGIKPLGDRIIVKPVEKEEVTKGGIVLPDTAQEKSQKGEVIAVGTGKMLDDGTIVPLEVKVGDMVLYGKYAGSEIKDDGEEFMIMKEDDVLAVIG